MLVLNTRYIAVLYITWRVIKLEKCQSPRNHKRCDIPDEVKALWDVAGTCQFLHQIWHLRGLHNMDALKGNINWFYSIHSNNIIVRCESLLTAFFHVMQRVYWSCICYGTCGILYYKNFVAWKKGRLLCRHWWKLS